MLSLVLVEAALEVVPPEIASHPSVLHSARRFGVSPNKMLLDVSFHYRAMKGLERRWKRGRPDIIHGALLECQGSPLVRNSLLQAAIHTIGGIAVTMNPQVRLPRNYMRFVGVFGKLLSEGRIKTANDAVPLLTARTMSLKELTDTLGSSKVVLLSEHGRRRDLLQLAAEALDEKRMAVLVGAFPHGDFEPLTKELADDIVSIFPATLDTGVVVSRFLACCELAAGAI